MYQKYYDILYKLKLHQSLIDEFRKDLKEVKITNAIERYYGKTYIRVYIELIAKEDSSRYPEFREKYQQRIFGWTKDNYISFYLPDYKRDREELSNRSEELDYDWIVNILEFGSWGHTSPKFEIQPFRSLLNEKEDNERWTEDYEVKRNSVLKSLNDCVQFSKNQLVVIKNYSSFRVGRIKEIPQQNRSFNSLNLIEVRKDLTNGVREMSYANVYDIYAVIDPFQLERNFNKNMILSAVQSQKDFKGLIYLRPKDLW